MSTGFYFTPPDGSQPGRVPPAFRGRNPTRPFYIGLTDEQVLNAAEAALDAVQKLPIGSRERAQEWERFDRAMGEMKRRGRRYALGKLRELREGELPDGGVL